MGERALLTGATGFVGSHLAQRLVADGSSVHAIVRTASASLPAGVTAHVHDGTTEGLHRILQATAPDVVFHLASLFIAQHRTEDVRPLIESNVLFGSQLVDAMAATGTRLLVNTGTAWQHYENAAYDPVDLYAATKQAFEAILRFYESSAGLKVVTLKLFDTYGPGDRRAKLLSLLIRALGEREPFKMSPGEQQIDLLHVDDVVEAFALARQRLRGGQVATSETWALSSGAPMTLRQLVAELERAAGARLNVEWGARPYRPREVMRAWNQGLPLPGWRPRVSLQEGLRQLLQVRSIQSSGGPAASQ